MIPTRTKMSTASRKRSSNARILGKFRHKFQHGNSVVKTLEQCAHSGQVPAQVPASSNMTSEGMTFAYMHTVLQHYCMRQ